MTDTLTSKPYDFLSYNTNYDSPYRRWETDHTRAVESADSLRPDQYDELVKRAGFYEALDALYPIDERSLDAVASKLGAIANQDMSARDLLQRSDQVDLTSSCYVPWRVANGWRWSMRLAPLSRQITKEYPREPGFSLVCTAGERGWRLPFWSRFTPMARMSLGTKISEAAYTTYAKAGQNKIPALTLGHEELKHASAIRNPEQLFRVAHNLRGLILGQEVQS